MICAATSLQCAETDLRQVMLQEFGAAADVTARELGAIGLLAIGTAAQITDVVEQRQHHAEHAALRAELQRTASIWRS